MKAIDGQQRLTIAFIAIGVSNAISSLSSKPLEQVINAFDGLIGVVDEATLHWRIIEKLYAALNGTERDKFGCWDYEVSESFGYLFVFEQLKPHPRTPLLVLQDVVTISTGISNERFDSIFTKENTTV